MTVLALGEIGIKAMAYQQAADARRVAFLAFSSACHVWKAENGYDRIERHTPEWRTLLEGIPVEQAALWRAMADERNARARLFRACRKAQK